MKEFKLNGFEKFVIRYKPVLMIILLISMILSLSYFNISFWGIHFEFNWSVVRIIIFIMLLLLYLYVATLFNIKNERLIKLQNEMNPAAALEGNNLLIEILPEKRKNEMAFLCNNRIAYLINMGEFQRAEEEIKMFWQVFDLYKLPAHLIFCTHCNMMPIMIENGDMKGFEAQKNAAYMYWSRCKPLQRKMVNDDFINFQLYIKAHTVTDINFENVALSSLNFKNGKPRKNAPSPMKLFEIYEILFNYFNRIGNRQKAVQYAQFMTNIGNEQFEQYRKAKEFLENANQGN